MTKQRKEDEFFDDLRRKMIFLATFYDIDPAAAAGYADSLAVMLSAEWGGDRIAISRTDYIDSRHLGVYLRWQAAKRRGLSPQAAAEQAAQEVGYSPRQVFRIVRDIESRAHNGAANG